MVRAALMRRATPLRMRHGAIAFGLVTIALSTVTLSCHRSKSYESEVEVTRISVVRKDEAGKPATTDFEFSYTACPGTQIETVRGDAKFAQCVARYSVGQKIKLKLEHHWSDEGHYVWTVHKVGDCDRTVDPADEASFAMLRECEDWEVNGARVGFQCSLKAERKLVDKCPWFRRH
jgi:hypothetical protein